MRRLPKITKIGAIMRANEIWADKEVQRQLLAMGKKQNIWENIAAKLNENGYKRYKLLII